MISPKALWRAAATSKMEPFVIIVNDFQLSVRQIYGGREGTSILKKNYQDYNLKIENYIY